MPVAHQPLAAVLRQLVGMRAEQGGNLGLDRLRQQRSCANIATGLATMEPKLEDVLRALGASKLDIMLKIGIPRTQPYLFGSLKVAITLAFVGTVGRKPSAPTPGSDIRLRSPDRTSRCRLCSRRCFCSQSKASPCMPLSPMLKSISRAGRFARP